MNPELKTLGERAHLLLRLLGGGWQPTLWTIRIAVVAMVLVVVITIGYPYGITLWDWMKLLIVPAVIAGVGLWYNRQQREQDQQIADQRAYDEALQACIENIGKLLLDEDKPLRTTPEAHALARAHTWLTLSRLDSNHNQLLTSFLHDAGLFDKEDPIIRLGKTSQRGEPLEWDEVSGKDRLLLPGPDLSHLKLSGADLRDVDLTNVNLNFANLIGADLRGANLAGSLLVGADLVGADLAGATLDHAIFQWANLYRANNITDVALQQLAVRGALMGAVIPDGSRPLTVPPEVEAEFTRHPESELARRERELRRIAHIIAEQANSKDNGTDKKNE